MPKKFALLAAIGAVLLFGRVAFAQPLFGPPVNLGPKINTVAHETDPFLRADGKQLFFVRTSNIWYADWTDTGWTDPKSLGPQINTGPGIEHSPSVSPDGQRLYFVPDLRGGFFWDVWVSTFDSSIGDWGAPVNLGAPVNTSGVEFSAHLGPDGRRLYFTSDGSGRCGIYMSEWNDINWSVPQLQWGCGQDPQYPSVPADSQWLYFEEYVSFEIRIKAVAWDDNSGWVLPSYDLQSQIGDSSSTPFIVSSGDSLFFTSNRDVGGFGGADIWVARRLSRGDLNMDGQLTASDVILELNKVFLEEPYPAPEPSGDLNCDGRFTPADLVFLIQVVFLYVTPGC
jgi:hypothetical protein